MSENSSLCVLYLFCDAPNLDSAIQWKLQHKYQDEMLSWGGVTYATTKR